MSRFGSVLIANRGEIACRVIRAARAEGLRPVAVFSDADASAPHVRLADAAVNIGPPAPAQSYLSIPNLIAAAKASGAEAVHPGYGFLAERADFAEACAAAGLVFIGPPAAAIRAMGDKGSAKIRMQAAGVPCAPGYEGDDQSPARLAAEAGRVGYPVMVKASAGGGGRGMRLVRAPDELDAALRAAGAEASNAFGDGRLILEKALVDARHVEVQIFADANGSIVHLGERDCSIQRRHQKLIEEQPSPAVSPVLRAAMGEAAVRAAAAVAYVGAGTVEFLLDADGRFYFLEMNTRVQVEHPVTECVTGIDLVRLQFRVAQGEALPFAQADVAARGHAIEARLYAEDPAADFGPSTGRIVAWSPGRGEGVRVDSGVEQGATVSPHYDSLLAKVIAHGATREEARRRLVDALRETFVAGVATNRDFLVATLERPEFVDGQATTAFVTSAAKSAPPDDALALAALLFVARDGAPAPNAAWRASPLMLVHEDVEIAASVRRDRDEWRATVNGRATALRLVARTADEIRVAIDGVVRRARYALDGDDLRLDFGGASLHVSDRTYAPPRRVEDEKDGIVRSPVSGVVIAVAVNRGDRVRRGQSLATIESMKMQYSILAPIDGVVAEANAAPGRQMQAQAPIFAIEARERD